jgi:hypothetical protein
MFLAAVIFLGIGFVLGETIPGGIMVLLGIAALVAWILQAQRAFYPDAKHKSLRLTSFAAGTVTRSKRYGYYALVGILGSVAFSNSGVLFVEIVGDVLGLAGLAFGIAWIVLTVGKMRERGRAGQEHQQGQA